MKRTIELIFMIVLILTNICKNNIYTGLVNYLLMLTMNVKCLSTVSTVGNHEVLSSFG